MSLKLTAQLYKQILASLRSDFPSRGSEKRGQGRVGLRCSLDIVPCSFSENGAKPITVWVRDISMKGIGLVTSMPIAEGTLFIARLPRNPDEPLSVTYKVVYCRRLSSDLYSVGSVLETVKDEKSAPDKSGGDKAGAAKSNGGVAVGAAK